MQHCLPQKMFVPISVRLCKTQYVEETGFPLEHGEILVYD